MGPEALAQVLRPIAEMFRPEDHPDLLFGLGSPDDALVWKLDDDRALVHTADFFPPVVDDPYAFGAIAAANAISDVYAMGATPLFAINLVGFPDDMDPSILAEILRGGAEKVREAGAVVAGGHSTTDKEPKYGLSVTGLVRPDRVLSKGGARPGDVLILTKPLGAGIVTTAAKRQKASAPDLAAAIASMSRLSAGAAKIFRDAHPHVHALTDVTGFSLMGHAHEMAHLSGLALRLRWDELPLLPGTEGYARGGNLTGGGRKNQDYYGDFVDVRRALEPWQYSVLFDPQTSGPLLAAVDRSAADAVVASFRAASEPVWVVGEAIAGRVGGIDIS
jgi:selenide,water dikinase